MVSRGASLGATQDSAKCRLSLEEGHERVHAKRVCLPAFVPQVPRLPHPMPSPGRASESIKEKDPRGGEGIRTQEMQLLLTGLQFLE